MVAEGDGLGPLQMGITWHDGAGMRQGLVAQDPDQIAQLTPQGRHRPPQVQADVQRHLVVAAAPGVQALARVPDAGGQLALDEGVDVLRLRVDDECPRAQVGGDARQSIPDGLPVGGGEDPLLRQHGGVGHAARDILLRHSAVKGNGGIEVVGFLIDFLLKPSGP